MATNSIWSSTYAETLVRNAWNRAQTLGNEAANKSSKSFYEATSRANARGEVPGALKASEQSLTQPDGHVTAPAPNAAAMVEVPLLDKSDLLLDIDKADSFVINIAGADADAFTRAPLPAAPAVATLTTPTPPTSVVLPVPELPAAAKLTTGEMVAPTANVPTTPAAPTFVFNADVAEPDVFIPTHADGASLEMFDTQWDKITDKLAGMYADFIRRYFPNECDYLGHAQHWICDTLTKGGTGINPIVERQIWDRDRSRLLTEADRAEQEAMSTFAARGFPMPPGALHGAVRRIRAETRDKLAQASRDVAIKQAEMEVENVRFAVDKALSLYGVVMDAAKNFIAAMATGAGTSAQLLPSVTDSQSKLISAANEYYRSRISVEELRLKAATTAAELTHQANLKDYDGRLTVGLKNAELVQQAALQTYEAKTGADLKNVELASQTELRRFEAALTVGTKVAELNQQSMLQHMAAKAEASAKSAEMALQAQIEHSKAVLATHLKNAELEQGLAVEELRGHIEAAIKSAQFSSETHYKGFDSATALKIKNAEIALQIATKQFDAQMTANLKNADSLNGVSERVYGGELTTNVKNAEMVFEGDKFLTDAKLRVLGMRMEDEHHRNKLTLDAAIEEAKALATQTAAYLNSVHTSATLTGSESYTTGLGYSYNGEVSNDVAPVTEFR